MSTTEEHARTHREIVERMPLAMAKRPRDPRGYPVPWFVPWNPETDGWDFRYQAAGKAEQAVEYGLCWTCGEPFTGTQAAYVVGPMCAVNRTSAEPPSHIECAVYAARACPFLARPKMIRPTVRDGHDPAAAVDDMPGHFLDRNPGVALVWITENPSYDPSIRLFDLGDPVRVRWYAHSRKATREEVMESIRTGLPTLRKMAEDEGDDAVAELERLTARAMELVPA